MTGHPVGCPLKTGPESDPFSPFHGHHSITSLWVTVMPSSLVSGLPLCPASLSILTCRLMILSACQSDHASSAPNPPVAPISLKAEAKVLPEAHRVPRGLTLVISHGLTSSLLSPLAHWATAIPASFLLLKCSGNIVASGPLHLLLARLIRFFVHVTMMCPPSSPSGLYSSVTFPLTSFLATLTKTETHIRAFLILL